jgi:hypothetical protein
MELRSVPVAVPEAGNVIIGQSHFIKTVEDLHEALVQSSPLLRFGVAFCEASGPRLIRRSGNDRDLVDAAVEIASDIGAGHSFVITLRDGFPINVLSPVNMASHMRASAASDCPRGAGCRADPWDASPGLGVDCRGEEPAVGIGEQLGDETGDAGGGLEPLDLPGGLVEGEQPDRHRCVILQEPDGPRASPFRPRPQDPAVVGPIIRSMTNRAHARASSSRSLRPIEKPRPRRTPGWRCRSRRPPPCGRARGGRVRSARANRALARSSELRTASHRATRELGHLGGRPGDRGGCCCPRSCPPPSRRTVAARPPGRRCEDVSQLVGDHT